jgi:hypothetical protein
VGDDVLVAVAGQPDVQLLRGPAATAWLILEAPATARSLTSSLARAYGTTTTAIRNEVEGMLAALVSSGALDMNSDRD